jgi:hypothetical protein
MDPCGTPYFTGSGLEMLFPIHKLCFRSDKYEATLNEDLNSVSMWCTNNNMVINPTKTTCMLIHVGTKQRKTMMEK